MSRDKKIIYSISVITFAALFAIFFVNTGSSKIITACLLLPMAIITTLLIKKRTSLSINKREVLLLSTIIGVIYVILIQISGIFFGFYKNPYFVNLQIFLTVIIPTLTIIITTELIRSVFLAQKNSFASVFAFLSCVLAETLVFSDLAGITTFNKFMDLVGLTLFPAISANIYYHYVSKRFGALPNIAFRLITTFYIYLFPNVSAISNALLACIEIFLPIIMLALVSALFEKKKRNAIQNGKKVSVISMILSILIVASISMIISCQFRFGAIVIATESMTGEINKGDMIIYERYDGQAINEGQVIVFLQHNNKIIHRVVKIEHKGNETRYYTKGDANEDLDFGYRTEADIVGLTDMKLAYVGFPTLWLRELLDSSN